MKLYELAPQYRALTEYLSEETDGVKFNEESFKAQLAQITVELKDKAVNIGKLILENNAEVEGISKELERLTSRKRIIESKTEWLKNYVTVEMQNADLDRIEGVVLTLSLQKSPPSCIILDEKIVPKKFIKVIPEQRQVDRLNILKNFKETGEIPEGVNIVVDKKFLRIR